jgi:hypothetical protein
MHLIPQRLALIQVKLLGVSRAAGFEVNQSLNTQSRLPGSFHAEASQRRLGAFPTPCRRGHSGLGQTPAEAFKQAALAWTAIVSHAGVHAVTLVVAVRRDAPDLELLFVDGSIDHALPKLISAPSSNSDLAQ